MKAMKDKKRKKRKTHIVAHLPKRIELALVPGHFFQQYKLFSRMQAFCLTIAGVFWTAWLPKRDASELLGTAVVFTLAGFVCLYVSERTASNSQSNTIVRATPLDKFEE